MITRRTLLKGLGASIAALAMGPILPARLAANPAGLKFLFVFNYGGWDPTTVFAPMFEAEGIDMELDAVPATVGGIPFVDHASRPSVRSFLERWHGRTLVLNGVSVSSLAHDVCTLRMLTGTSSVDSPDWATRLAYARKEEFTLPHLVLTGLSYTGEMGDAVARAGANGQLDGLLSGIILDQSDLPAGRPDALKERILDRYFSSRVAARAASARAGADAKLAGGLQRAHERAMALKGWQYDMDFVPGGTLLTQAGPAVKALSLGLARCVSLAASSSWDTHEDNAMQSGLFETLFDGLGEIMDLLTASPGSNGGTLADETVVVVLSEMGRTPQLNTNGGRDHWPYTSAMIVGPGVTGDRVVGGFDDLYYGKGVDPVSAEIDPNGPLVSTEVLGATLLTLAGIDPTDIFRQEVTPLWGVLT